MLLISCPNIYITVVTVQDVHKSAAAYLDLPSPSAISLGMFQPTKMARSAPWCPEMHLFAMHILAANLYSLVGMGAKSIKDAERGPLIYLVFRRCVYVHVCEMQIKVQQATKHIIQDFMHIFLTCASSRAVK